MREFKSVDLDLFVCLSVCLFVCLFVCYFSFRQWIVSGSNFSFATSDNNLCIRSDTRKTVIWALRYSRKIISVFDARCNNLKISTLQHVQQRPCERPTNMFVSRISEMLSSEHIYLLFKICFHQSKGIYV